MGFRGFWVWVYGFGVQDFFTVLLVGSWVVIRGVRSRITITTTHISGLTTPLRTTHEPPSGVWGIFGVYNTGGLRSFAVQGFVVPEFVVQRGSSECPRLVWKRFVLRGSRGEGACIAYRFLAVLCAELRRLRYQKAGSIVKKMVFHIMATGLLFGFTAFGVQCVGFGGLGLQSQRTRG